MGNENRGCIGCHEDRELSPPNILAKAVTKPAVDLTLPEEQRRTVDFRNQIVPLLQSNCSTRNCHVPGNTELNLQINPAGDSDSESRQVYEALLYPVTDGFYSRYVIPGKASESPLIWHLFGRSLRTGQTKVNGEIHLMPPDHPLKAEERLVFIEWIDLGATWDQHGLIKSEKLK
jgi:hypothetical protein